MRKHVFTGRNTQQQLKQKKLFVDQISWYEFSCLQHILPQFLMLLLRLWNNADNKTIEITLKVSEANLVDFLFKK